MNFYVIQAILQDYPRMWVEIILFLGVHLVYGGTHSLQYFYTATSGLQNVPQFVSVGIVDGQPFTYYDSNIRRMTPRQEWMDKSVGKEYWELQTRVSINAERALRNNINIAKDRFNHTGGVHTFQRMYGCNWDDETGATNAFRQEGYDGEDFMFLDFKEFRWISPVQQGFQTIQKWNNDKDDLHYEKQYFSTECIEWLQKYLQYGKSSLQRTVSPQVSVLQKDSSSPIACHATGFYPKEVSITWQRNGQEHYEDVDLGKLLPNEDGTFQKTSSLKVTPDELKKNQYSCVVKHQGKSVTEDEIRTNQGGSLPIGIIVGALAAVILLIGIAVAGYLVYKKKKAFKPVSGSDDGSNSSANAIPNA